MKAIVCRQGGVINLTSAKDLKRPFLCSGRCDETFLTNARTGLGSSQRSETDVLICASCLPQTPAILTYEWSSLVKHVSYSVRVVYLRHAILVYK